MSRHEDDVRSVGDSLERWYAERGSREFTGVWRFKPLPPPRNVCFCGAPGKRHPLVGVACADHWPAVVG